MNLLEKIKASTDRKLHEVEIPEWDCKVWVKVMSGFGRDRLEAEMRKPNGNVRAVMAVYCACDEEGNLLFKPEDISWLTEKSYRALDRIMEVAAGINELTAEAIESLKETLKKTTFADSSSASHDTTDVASSDC